jgi:hypothetical protein
MRAALPLAAALTLLAGVASAQTPTAPPAPPAPSADPAPAAAPAAKPKTAGDTVSGLTVLPIPRKACSSRDKDCIAMVVAELKRFYPEQLKQFCFTEQTKAVRNQMVGDQLYESLGVARPPPTAFPVSPIVKTACASDKK